MKNLLQDLKDFVMFDILNRPLPTFIKEWENEIEFTAHKEKTGVWAEAKNYPGLVASAKNEAGLREAITDSVLTYFDIPRSTAKRMPDDAYLETPKGKIISPKKPRFGVRFKLARA